MDKQELKHRIAAESEKLKNLGPAPIEKGALPLLWFWYHQDPDFDALFYLLAHNIYFAIEKKLKPGRVHTAPIPKLVIETFIRQENSEFMAVERAMENIVEVLNAEADSTC